MTFTFVVGDITHACQGGFVEARSEHFGFWNRQQHTLAVHSLSVPEHVICEGQKTLMLFHHECRLQHTVSLPDVRSG
jgi:hypothetical protein